MAGAQYCSAVGSCRGEERWKTLSEKKETRELDAASLIVLLNDSRAIHP